MLEVTDEDGASDTITVLFGVQDTPSDPMFSDDEVGVLGLLLDIFGIFFALFVMLFILGLLIRHFSGDSAVIPKWKRE